MKKLLFVTLILAAIFCFSLTAFASLTFVPNSYGLSAKSIGLGNAMTAVGDDYSMAFFNPGALGTLETNQLDISYLYAAPRFNGGPETGEEVDFDVDNKLTLIGFTMNLSGLFNNKHGVGLGFDIAIDNNLKSFLAFDESRDDDGQFFRYGLTSVTMITSLGVKIIPQLHVGIGGYVMVKGENTLVAETDLAGETKQEEIQVNAEPAFAPIIGIYAPAHEMVTIGAVYRGRGKAEFTKIDASTDALVSESSLTKLNLLMSFTDTYVPQQAALGVAIRPIPELMIAIDTTWFNWADYSDEVLEKDVVRGDSDFETKDIYVPRLGIEYSPIEELYLRFGYYYEETPFDGVGIGNTVILDNTKHVGSLGIGWDVSYIPFLAHPLSLGVTYFNHYLVPRTVKADDGREFESSGDLNGVIGTITLRF